jgi:hypothetical protein
MIPTRDSNVAGFAFWGECTSAAVSIVQKEDIRGATLASPPARRIIKIKQMSQTLN